MADAKRPAVWAHHPPSGRTQRVSATAWDAGELAADGWLLATDEQVVVASPPSPVDADPPPRSRRNR